MGIVAAAILFGLYLWWRRKRHTTLSEKTFERIVDPAVSKLDQRHGQQQAQPGPRHADARPGAPGSPKPGSLPPG
jgi:hypothetical protein